MTIFENQNKNLAKDIWNSKLKLKDFKYLKIMIIKFKKYPCVRTK